MIQHWRTELPSALHGPWSQLLALPAGGPVFAGRKQQTAKPPARRHPLLPSLEVEDRQYRIQHCPLTHSVLRDFFPFTQRWVQRWCTDALEWWEQWMCSALAPRGQVPHGDLFWSISVLYKCTGSSSLLTMKAFGPHHGTGSPGVTAPPLTGKNKSSTTTIESESIDRFIKAGIGIILFPFLWDIPCKKICS